MDKWRRFGIGGGSNTNGTTPKEVPTDAVVAPVVESKGKERAVDEVLWGLENFGNTCYCNSILQALYASPPFRAFVESYPNVQKPYNALGGAIATGPIPTPSPESLQKPNPLETVPVASPVKEKRGGILGLGKSKAAATPTVARPVLPTPPPQQLPPPIILPHDPNFPEMTLFSTIQTLFDHMNTSLPHLPAAPKTPQAAAAVAASAVAAGGAAASLPSASLVQSPTAGAGPGQPPQGPSLLASLPPPSCVRGAGPYSAGTLGRGVVRPEDVLRTVRRTHQLFAGQGQQDAHEFLGFMLNQLAEEIEGIDAKLKEKGEEVIDAKDRAAAGKTFIHSLFHGVLVNETRCLNCETTSAREESFLDLSIDIEQHSSLTACLRQFSHSEMLCSTNKFYCETCCGLVEAERRMRIKSLPNILGLHLKRFRQDEMGRLHKLFYRVTFPLQLRVPCTTEDTEDGERVYELFAVVVHIGNGPTHGHYVTVVRSSGQWVMCDDENVEPIEEEDLANYFGDNITGAGYVLFYQAVDIDLKSLGLKKIPVPRVPPVPPTPKPFHIAMMEDDESTPLATTGALPPVHEPASVFIEGPPPMVPVKAPVQPPPIASPTPAAPVTPIKVSVPQRTDSAHSSIGPTPERDHHADQPRQPSSASRSPREPTSNFREPSSTSPAENKSKWYSMKKRDSVSSGSGLQRQPSTATTLNTVSDGASARGASHAELPQANIDQHHADLSSSMLSTATTHTTSSGNSHPSTNGHSAAPLAIPTPNRAASSTRPDRSSSVSRPDRSASGTSFGGNNGYGGGVSLGRKISGAAGFGKLARSSSNAFKMGFGKKNKVDEEGH